jgi:hypothetical protein
VAEWQRWSREVGRKHAPADPTMPLVVRCLLLVDLLDVRVKVWRFRSSKAGIGVSGSCSRLREPGQSIVRFADDSLL